MRFILFSFCFLMVVSCFGSGNPFVDGNHAFQAKDYEKAIEYYEIHIQDRGHSRFQGFHNLGNAYYRVGNYSKAILNYERALLIQPNNKRLQQNLKVANQKIEDQFAKAEVFFLVKWWRSWRNLFSTEGWAIFAILMASCSAIGLGFWRLGKSRKKRKRGFFIGFTAFGLLLLFSLTAWQRDIVLKNPKTAIVIKKEIDLKTAADEESPTVLLLHNGTKIRLIDELGDWQKVQLPNGDLGWLEKENFERI